MSNKQLAIREHVHKTGFPAASDPHHSNNNILWPCTVGQRRDINALLLWVLTSGTTGLRRVIGHCQSGIGKENPDPPCQVCVCVCFESGIRETNQGLDTALHVGCRMQVHRTAFKLRPEKLVNAPCDKLARL